MNFFKMNQIDNPFEKVELEIQLVTPQLASEWLKYNTHNRSSKDVSIIKYANDMVNNNWLFNGSTIVFSEDGILLDGQNRLLACIKAKVPFWTVIVKNVPNWRSCQSTMDAGVKRSFADHLKLEGEVNTSILAAGVGLCFSILSGFKRNTASISAAERIEFLDNNPRIRQSSSRASSIGDYSELKGIVTSGHISALHYLFTIAGENLHQPEAAEVFFSSLSLKDNSFLGEGMPFIPARNWIKNHSTNGSTIIPRDKTAILIKTFNSWMSGKEVKNLVWTSGGPRAEEYPKVYGLPLNFYSGR